MRLFYMQRKLNKTQELKKYSDRELEVYKRDDLIQKARFTLSVQEQKCILYAISKIKPNDTYLTEYIFDIKDFYTLCGIDKDSYTTLKKQLMNLKSKVWWLKLPDESESAVSWLDVVRVNKKSGKVTIAFHRDMMPFLLELARQAEENGAFYTGYTLQYVLPMSSQYSPRLYEILKSYQKNNKRWFFEIDELKYLLDCQNYDRWPDLRRFVIEPAVKEINKYTDLNIEYTTEKEGRKIVRIEFLMESKKKRELHATMLANNKLLDKTNVEASASL